MGVLSALSSLTCPPPRPAAALATFWRDETGAASVDMVPLVGVTMILGVATVDAISGAMRDQSLRTSDGIAAVEIATSFDPAAQPAVAEVADAGAEDWWDNPKYAGVFDEDAEADAPQDDANAVDEVALVADWEVPSQTLTPGWGPTVNSPWLTPAQFGVTLPASFTITGPGNPRAQTADGSTAASGQLDHGTILYFDTPACGDSATVFLNINDGEEVVSYTVHRPDWPDSWGAKPAGC